MKYLWFFLLGLYHCALADTIIDLYGLKEVPEQTILQKYAARVRCLETQIMSEILDMNTGNAHTALYQQLMTQKKHLIQEIKHDGQFGFVDIQTVHYPKDKNIYTTIEIIAHPLSPRMRFVSDSIYIGTRKRDLIEQMRQYTHLTMRLLLNKQLDLNDYTCPFYHCLTSFHHPQLKPYLNVFQLGAVQEKQMIIRTLNQDPSAERRAAAAFLIGMFLSPHEIIALLLPHINDSDSQVRNGVLRVLGTTIDKAYLTEINPKPFVALLDSPYGAERNKALKILSILSESSKGRIIIRQYGYTQLQQLSKLFQPNNHDLANIVLNKITYPSLNEQQFLQGKTWNVPQKT